MIEVKFDGNIIRNLKHLIKISKQMPGMIKDVLEKEAKSIFLRTQSGNFYDPLMHGYEYNISEELVIDDEMGFFRPKIAGKKRKWVRVKFVLLDLADNNYGIVRYIPSPRGGMVR